MKEENKRLTMSQVERGTLDKALILKIKTNAKNLPEVWAEAISLLEQECEKQQKNFSEGLKMDFRAISDRRTKLK